MTESPNLPASSVPADQALIESRVGLWLFSITLGYVVLITIFDSIRAKRPVISKNSLRHLLDGLTLATGCTIMYSIWDISILKIVASNAVYTTVTSITCVFGPLINLAERYNMTIDS